MSTPDPVNHPQHYMTHRSGIECIQITEHLNFCLGNTLKYIWRADEKGDAINDLSKAIWYLEREITRRKALADIENARLIGVIADCLEKDLVTKSASSPDVTGSVLAYAQAGDARQQYEMGRMCFYGDGMPQDYEAAVEWWQKAAEQGNAEAQKALSFLVTKSVSLPTPASSPNTESDQLARLASPDDARRQYEMGKMCYYGDGIPQDYEVAVEWWQKAAEQGNYEAQLALVSAYRTGTGVEKNGRLANYWLEHAGRQPAKDQPQGV